MQSTPDAILSFCDDQEIFLAILEIANQSNAPLPTKFCASMRFSNENTILHQISKDPLSDKQMELIMYALQQNDVRPDAKNNDGKTFLNLSPIYAKLLQRFQSATDDWTKTFFNTCTNNTEIIEAWIKLGNDDLLESTLRYNVSHGKLCTVYNWFILYWKV